MKILIISEGKKVSGPTTWKEGLISHLRQAGMEAEEVPAKGVRSLFSLFKVKKATVVHGYHVSGTAILYLMLARLLEKRIVFTVHGNFLAQYEDQAGWYRMIWIPFHNFALHLANIITFPSAFLKHSIEQHNPNQEKKMWVVHNGIVVGEEGPATIKPIKNPPRLVSITNFIFYEKAMGLEPLSGAVDLLQSEFPGLTLTVLGDGQYFDYFREGLAGPNIRFVGRQRPDAYLKDADLSVHSTYLDNSPYSILESMAARVPTMGVSVGGIPEMLSHSALADPNRESLYILMKKVLQSESYRKRVIKENTQKLKGFDWQNVVQDFIRLYERHRMS